MTEIVIATANPHKVDEMRAIFASLIPNARLLGLGELGGPPPTEPAETGSTFEDNSSIKAVSYATVTGRLCLADDSGLEIDALGGRPGVISSHYCTDGREAGMSRGERDEANNKRVLRELDGVAPENRGARFVCVMTFSDAQGKIVGQVRGTFEGRIGMPGDVPRGKDGFGYDPLFLVAPAFAATSAELSSEEKNRVSHRRSAAEQIARIIRSLYN